LETSTSFESFLIKLTIVAILTQFAIGSFIDGLLRSKIEMAASNISQIYHPNILTDTITYAPEDVNT
jgi:hypothetical protein